MFEAEFNPDPIHKLLKQLADQYGIVGQTDAAYRAGQKAAARMEQAVSPYPTASGKPLPLIYTRTSTAKKHYRPSKGAPFREPGETFQSKFKSAAQQGAVFVKVSDGLVPYRRTGTLGKSITSVVEKQTGRILMKIGTSVPYASLIIGSKDIQALYHQGTWTPLEDDIRRDLPEIMGTFERSLFEVLKW